MKNKIYICIPIHNRIELTMNCLRSIYRQDYKNFQVIICDDGSIDNSSEIIKNNFKDGDGNLWWAGATNACIRYVLKSANNEDYIFTLNNDTELNKDCLKILLNVATLNPKSIIGAINLFYDERSRIEPSAQKENSFLGFKYFTKVNKWGESITSYSGNATVSALSGKGVLLPVRIFKEIGIYNSDLLPHYHADTEFSIRAARNGYKLLLNFDAKVFSHQQESGIGTRTSKPNIKEFFMSFGRINSAHHFKSLKNRSKLIYKKMYLLYLFLNILGIFLGFLKRYSTSKFKHE